MVFFLNVSSPVMICDVHPSPGKAPKSELEADSLVRWRSRTLGIASPLFLEKAWAVRTHASSSAFEAAVDVLGCLAPTCPMGARAI